MMWISLFMIATAAAIVLSVGAVVLQNASQLADAFDRSADREYFGS
jgi:hypothetical protein